MCVKSDSSDSKLYVYLAYVSYIDTSVIVTLTSVDPSDCTALTLSMWAWSCESFGNYNNVVVE